MTVRSGDGLHEALNLVAPWWSGPDVEQTKKNRSCRSPRSVVWFYTWLGRAQGPAAVSALHPDADLACAAIKTPVGTHGGVAAVNGQAWRIDESRRVKFSHRKGLDLLGELVHEPAPT